MRIKRPIACNHVTKTIIIITKIQDESSIDLNKRYLKFQHKILTHPYNSCKIINLIIKALIRLANQKKIILKQGIALYLVHDRGNQLILECST